MPWTLQHQGAKRATPGTLAYLVPTHAHPGLGGQLWRLQRDLTKLHRVWRGRGAQLKPAAHTSPAALAPRATVSPPTDPNTTASGKATLEQLLL